jgi:hypothetical protein
MGRMSITKPLTVTLLLLWLRVQVNWKPFDCWLILALMYSVNSHSCSQQGMVTPTLSRF